MEAVDPCWQSLHLQSRESQNVGIVSSQYGSQRPLSHPCSTLYCVAAPAWLYTWFLYITIPITALYQFYSLNLLNADAINYIILTNSPCDSLLIKINAWNRIIFMSGYLYVKHADGTGGLWRLSGCIPLNKGLKAFWCTGCYIGKSDGLEVQGLDKEIRTDYHHELHSNCYFFSGKSAAEGYGDQISLRTSYFEQVTVVTTEKNGDNDESCIWHSQNLTFSVQSLRVITTFFQFLNNPLLPRALPEDGHIQC